MLSLKRDIGITPPSPKIQGSLRKLKKDFKSQRWWVTMRNDKETGFWTVAHRSSQQLWQHAQALKPDKPSVESEVNGKSHPCLRPWCLLIAAGRRESVFFKAVAPATSAVLQWVTTQPRVYEQHGFDVLSLKEDIKLGRWGRGMGGKS